VIGRVKCLHCTANLGDAVSLVYWKLFKNNISTLIQTRPTNDANDPTIVYLSLRFHKLIQLVSRLLLWLAYLLCTWCGQKTTQHI